MGNFKIIIEAAIASRTEIDIIYQAGSHPGAVRSILPLRITEGLLKAREVGSGLSKSYKLELLSFPENGLAAELDAPFRSYHGLHDLLLLEQNLIMRSQLFILADRFNIRLYDSEKDSVSAAPLLTISYQKYPQGSSQNTPLKRPENPQPWTCCGASFSELQQAAEAFVTALRLYVIKHEKLPMP